MLETFTALFVAHLVADFVLQFRWIIDNKHRVHGFALHTLIVGLTAAIALGALGPGSSQAVMAVLLATAAHALIDALKIWLSGTPWVRNSLHGQLSLFLADQLAHLLTLGIIALLFSAAWQSGYWASNWPHIEGSLLPGFCLLGGFLLTTRAGGFAIAFFMQGFLQPTEESAPPQTPPESVKKSEPGLPQGGAWIGLLERTLIFLLVLMGQFGAIGFLIAAKSILRFQYASERSHGEFVIIGTLASFTWAILFTWLTTQALQQFS